MKTINAPTFRSSMLLGIAQILQWGGSFFLLAVLTKPIIEDTGWSHELVYGSLSLALLISGLLAPAIGKRIGERDNNGTLLYSGMVIALGLILIAIARHILLFAFGWSVIGVGMAMGLYDALFPTLGKRYGSLAGKAITHITLISGFCTTIVWPAITLLLEHFSWRTTCLIYAAALVIFIYPLYRLAFRSSVKEEIKETGSIAKTERPAEPVPPKIYYLIMVSFTISSILMTGISVHLIDILVNNNISLPLAVSLGALLGPSQVGARLMDMLLPGRSPLITAVFSAAGVLLGFILLLCSPQVAFLGVIFYGLGNGIRTILRGTLPLHVFGPQVYANVMGRLARPQLIAQALTPFAGGFMIRKFGTDVFLAVLCGLAVVNVLLTISIRYFENIYIWKQARSLKA